MTRHRGFRYKSRSVLTKERGSRTTPSPEKYVREFQVNDRVVIMIDPSIHKGMPHRRYHGLVGRIVEKRGRGYIVEVMLGNKQKLLSLLPDHMRPLSVTEGTGS